MCLLIETLRKTTRDTEAEGDDVGLYGEACAAADKVQEMLLCLKQMY